MAIEMLNAAIKAHVSHFVSEAQVTNFVQNWALLESVQARLRDFIGYTSSTGRRDASDDVATLVAVFKEVIGSTWQQATGNNSVCHVTTGHQRQKVPWREVRQVMHRTGPDAPAAFIRKCVSELTPFFTWSA